jgi:hypothetical protein
MLHVNALSGFGGRVSKTDKIVFVGGKVGVYNTTTYVDVAVNSGLTGGVASSASSGDIIIGLLCVGSYNDDLGMTIGTTGGTPYTLIGSELYKQGVAGGAYPYEDSNLRVAYKFSTGDTTVRFSSGPGSYGEGGYGVYVFRNVDTVNPINAIATATGNTSTPDPPAITPVDDYCYIVAVVGEGGYHEAANYTDPADLTDWFEADGYSSYSGMIGFGHKPSHLGGSFDPAAVAGTGSPESWCAMTFALTPAD